MGNEYQMSSNYSRKNKKKRRSGRLVFSAIERTLDGQWLIGAMGKSNYTYKWNCKSDKKRNKKNVQATLSSANKRPLNN